MRMRMMQHVSSAAAALVDCMAAQLQSPQASA